MWIKFYKEVHMVYTFNPSMEGKDRWNPEFQKPCLQKAKQKQTNEQQTSPNPPKNLLHKCS